MKKPFRWGVLDTYIAVNALFLFGLLFFLTHPQTLMPIGAQAFALASAFAYSLLVMMPLWLVTRLLGRVLPRFAGALALVLISLMLFLLLLDTRLYQFYGYHFNGFVWNLITTPGGLESMGSSGDAIRDVTLLGGGFLIAQVVLLVLLAKLFKPRELAIRGRIKALAWSGFAVLLACQLTFGFAKIYAYQPVLNVVRHMPVYIHTSVAGFATGVLGITPARESIVVSSTRKLRYPEKPIMVADKPWSPNIIWLVSESLRADMLTPEIMPNLWKFSLDAHRFTNHYSGGNGTRMGMFSMFYGLPGNYWFSFLARTQAPIVMQQIVKRNYDLGIYTSNSFVYPEFNRTVFADVPSDQLHTDDVGEYWKADRRNTKRIIDFINKDHQGKPFFTFMFFNSPHARYYFPPESVIRPNYLKDFNYAREDYADLKKNIELIRNRYINSVHHLDQQLGRVLDDIKAQGILDDTIVIITGDHGEEFMERGRWGHNSEIHNGQIHTPLVLWIPGKGKGVSDYPTSHLDIVATLLPLLGVQNPVSDYSEGVNLLDPPASRYRLSASWSQMAYIDDQYKVVLPVGAGNMGGTEVTTADDLPVEHPGKVMKGLRDNLARVLVDISRFQGR